MNAESKRLWKRICREIINPDHHEQAKLLLDWMHAERRQLLEALQHTLAYLEGDSDDKQERKDHAEACAAIASAKGVA